MYKCTNCEKILDSRNYSPRRYGWKYISRREYKCVECCFPGVTQEFFKRGMLTLCESNTLKVHVFDHTINKSFCNNITYPRKHSSIPAETWFEVVTCVVCESMIKRLLYYGEVRDLCR